MGSNEAFLKLVRYVNNQIKINNTLIALKKVDFEKIKIWQEFWKDVCAQNRDT